MGNMLKTLPPYYENFVSEEVLNKNIKKLDMLLRTYLLFDNYEDKNEVIIKDLQKKVKNQNKDIKNLDETTYRQKEFLENKKKKINNILYRNKIYNILSIILLIIIAVIIYVFKDDYKKLLTMKI